MTEGMSTGMRIEDGSACSEIKGKMRVGFSACHVRRNDESDSARSTPALSLPRPWNAFWSSTTRERNEVSTYPRRAARSSSIPVRSFRTSGSTVDTRRRDNGYRDVPSSALTIEVSTNPSISSWKNHNGITGRDAETGLKHIGSYQLTFE